MKVKDGQYIRYAYEPTQRMYWCYVLRAQLGMLILLRNAPNNTIIVAPYDASRVQVLPNSLTPVAQQNIQVNPILHDMEKWCDKAFGAGELIISCAAPGLAGGAATMSGLSTIGGFIGGGAVSGVVMVCIGPAAVAGKGMMTLIDKSDNDTVSKHAAIGGMAAGGAIGGVSVVASISAAGTVTGLSGAGITSGLAALGGGSLVASGAGIAGGLIACSAIVTLPTLAVGGSVYALARHFRQNKLDNQHTAWVARWRAQGYT